MNSENETKESPLEKAKRLKAEKESKDQVKIETEAKKQADSQAQAEKMNALNSEKQDLESQLNEVDVKIEISRSEAHETRDTMKEGGLDKDEEFKGEYDSTISEVVGNLKELRNEKNRIKAELEQVDSNIKNFDINEAVAEGKEATQGAVESVKQENEEAITQVESYPGAETGDIKVANEVVSETNKEVNQVVENSDKNIGEVAAEKNVNNEKEFSINIKELKSKIMEAREKMLSSGAYLDVKDEIKLYSSLNKTEELKKVQEQAANYYEKQLGNYKWAGDKYKDLGNTEKAEIMYKKGIAENETRIKSDTKPNFVTVNTCARTAEMYEKLGDSEKSKEAYNNLIKIAEGIPNRDLSESYNEVAIAYEKIGNFGKAKETWEKYASSWGESKADRAAASYEKAGNKEKAEEFYKKAIAYQENRNEPDPEILAKAYTGIGQKEKAIEILNNEAKKLESRGATAGSYHIYETMDKYL